MATPILPAAPEGDPDLGQLPRERQHVFVEYTARTRFACVRRLLVIDTPIVGGRPLHGSALDSG